METKKTTQELRRQKFEELYLTNLDKYIIPDEQIYDGCRIMFTRNKEQNDATHNESRKY